MRQWAKLSMSSKSCLQLMGLACTAGGAGYGVALLQHRGSFHNQAECDGYHLVPPAVPSPEPGWPVFPAALFWQVAAATKLDNSLITTTQDVVPEPAPNASRISQIMRYGFPGLTNIRSLDDFVLSYDTRLRIPYWVLEHLTARSVAKNTAVDRNNCDFHEDGSIHEYFRSTNKDYKHSGYDRGHLAAAGNHRQSQEHCQQTFLLSNMAPQVGRGFNRDKWNELESYCRKLSREHRNVYVCTGPLFLPRQEDDGGLYVRYKVLGANHVAVPTHFFKVVVCESEDGTLCLESFLLPNAVIDDKVPLNTFHVPADVIERASGLLFFDKLNRNKFSKINGKTTGWF